MRKILYAFFGSCLVFFLFRVDSKHIETIPMKDSVAISDKLAVLSKEERKCLQLLFENFFFFDQFTYSIFGSKPMSIGRLSENKEATIGWSAWNKISGKFESEKFVVNEYTYKEKQFVLVANMENIEKVYLANKTIFDEFDSQMTLDSLKKSIRFHDSLFNALIHNDLILGVLLGYGVHNSQIFAANQRLTTEKRIPVKPFSSTHPIFFYFSKVMPPCFACDPYSSETIELREKYTQERAFAIQLAKKDSLFLQMLYRLQAVQ